MPLQVHSYAVMPGGKTAYLSELHSGAEVLVVDEQGNQQEAIVGRVKIETRPLVDYQTCICIGACIGAYIYRHKMAQLCVKHISCSSHTLLRNRNSNLEKE